MALPYFFTSQPLQKQISMNKSDLINALAEKEGLQHKEAFDIINLIFDGFTDTLKKDSRIEIRGFGSYTVRHYDSYSGRNPKTGKRVRVGDKRLPFFKVGKELKARVNSR
jgi:integration host factor subunit beta